jgi:hypothetical protein
MVYKGVLPLDICVKILFENDYSVLSYDKNKYFIYRLSTGH